MNLIQARKCTSGRQYRIICVKYSSSNKRDAIEIIISIQHNATRDCPQSYKEHVVQDIVWRTIANRHLVLGNHNEAQRQREKYLMVIEWGSVSAEQIRWCLFERGALNGISHWQMSVSPWVDILWVSWRDGVWSWQPRHLWVMETRVAKD